jgi:beta-1,2-mannobiose phosphorylase / 1,2-beta-oligomannan phosphorylase
MGVAVLDGERPSRVLYRTALPILEPQAEYECNGLDKDVVFPSASDLQADGTLDVYYGAADRVIAAARVTLPSRLPTHQQGSTRDSELGLLQ